MKSLKKILGGWLGWRRTVLALSIGAFVASGAGAQAALIDFYFNGTTDDPAPGGLMATGHLRYDDVALSISDLTFSIGGETPVSFTRDNSFSPILDFIPLPGGGRQLFLSDLWVAGGANSRLSR